MCHCLFKQNSISKNKVPLKDIWKEKVKSLSQWKLNKRLKTWSKITCNELEFFFFLQDNKIRLLNNYSLGLE